MPNEFKVKNGLIVDQGGATITGSLSVSGSITTNGLSTGSVLFTSGSNGIITGSANLFWDNTNGRLGIGTATPSKTFDIRGTLNLQRSTADYFAKLVGSDGNVVALIDHTEGSTNKLFFIGGSTNSSFQFTPTGTGTTSFSTGNVLIGTTTDAGFKLDVNGTARIKGTGATSATTALLIQNSTPTTLFQIQDHGSSSFAGNMTVTGSITGFVPLTSSGSLASLNGYQAPYQHEAFIEVGMRQLDAEIPVGISILGGSNIAGTKGGFLESQRGRRAISFNDLGIVSIATTQISSSQYSALSIGSAATSIGSLTPNRVGIQLAVLPRSILMTGDAALQQEVSFNSFATSSLRTNIYATTYTNAYNVYIEGQPTAGSNVTFTNAYSLYVNSGKTYLGGNTLIGTTTDAGFKLDVSGSARITNGLTVTGSFDVGVPGTNSPRITSTGTLNRGDIVSVDWINRRLIDSSTITSVDWENRALYTPNGVEAFNYASYNDDVVSSQLYIANYINNQKQQNLTEYAKYSGQIIGGTIDASVAVNDIMYLNTDGIWYPLKNLPTISTKMLGIEADEKILIEGDMTVSDDGSVGTYVVSASYGLPVYLSDTLGQLTTVVPGIGVIRVVGHIYYQSTVSSNVWLMKFRPSNDWT